MKHFIHLNDFSKQEIFQIFELAVRRHIVVGANCILFSVYRPTRLCRIGTYRRF